MICAFTAGKWINFITIEQLENMANLSSSGSGSVVVGV